MDRDVELYALRISNINMILFRTMEDANNGCVHKLEWIQLLNDGMEGNTGSDGHIFSDSAKGKL